MSLLKLTSNYAAFNTWANTQIIDWLVQLPQADLYREVPSSFTTIDYTLQHILRTQRFWHLFILQKSTSHLNWSVSENKAHEVMQALLSESVDMENSFNTFDEAALLQTLHLDTPWAKNNLSRYEYIMHIVNHGTFHRGQIITMARCLGIKNGIPNTDYNIFNCIN